MQCVRCQQAVAPSADPCPNAPDGGPHEGIAPPSMRRSGWSLHLADCPARAPFLVGPDYADAACICREPYRP